MSHYPLKNKSFSFSADGSLNQSGLREIIQSISPKILRPAIKYTLLVASEHATASARLCIFKSLQTIADESGISKDTARRHLRLITEMGILDRKIMLDRDTGKQRPCLYTYTPTFVRIGKAFRRVADALKTRRCDEYKAALNKFNALLTALISRAASRSTRPEPVADDEIAPLQSATLSPSQNQTQYNRSSDPVDKKDLSENVFSENTNHTASASHPLTKSAAPEMPITYTEDMRADLATAITTKRTACQDIAYRQRQAERKNARPRTNGTPWQKQDSSTTFPAGIYEAANREEEARAIERQRAAASMTPEKTQARINDLRALLKRTSTTSLHAGA